LSDILKNPAFQEFLQKRCEEITIWDDEYQRLTSEVAEAYKSLQKSLNNFANLSTKLQAYSEVLMLRSDIYTAQSTAQNSISHKCDVTINSKMLHNEIND
jgi:hypothetical protein